MTTTPNPFPFNEEPTTPALRVVTDDDHWSEMMARSADQADSDTTPVIIRERATPVTPDGPPEMVTDPEAVSPAPEVTPRPVAGPMSYWATGITVTSNLALAVVAHVAQPPDRIVVLNVTVITICGLLLMCAEMLPRAIENRRAAEYGQ